MLTKPGGYRWKQAGATFVLTLATGTIVWTLARREGHREALRPTPLPTAAPTLFTEPRIAAPKAELEALLKARGTLTSTEEKKALAARLADFARKAHLQSAADSSVSLAAYNTALALRQEIGDRRSEADLLQQRAETLALLGQPEQAQQDLKKALSISQESADTLLQQAVILYLLGESEQLAGRYDSARRYLDHSLRIRQQNKERNGEADCLRALGQVSYEEGQYALARRSLEEAIPIYASLGNAQSRAAAMGQLGDVALAEGEFEEADRLYQQGLSIWQEAKQEYWIGRFLARQAALALKSNQQERAEQLARKSLAFLSRSNNVLGTAWARTVLGELALLKGNRAEGRKWLEQAQSEFSRLGNAFRVRQLSRLLSAS